jgi:hypothetical protein
MLKSLLAACALLGTATAAQQVSIGKGSIVETVARLKAGEFVWAPEAAPAGPVLVVVNVKTQRAVVFRNGVPIAASTVSTGKPGYSTPTGVFTILQKHVEHYSSTYDNAPMPYMQRLTWRGVALHAGRLPGYPASHGCIRLPAEFAKLLYGVTRVGMTVVVTDTKNAPKIAPRPDLIAAGRTATLRKAAIEWHPEKSPEGPVSIVVSAADRRAVVIRNGVIIGSAPVTIDGPVTGTWAYALRNVDARGPHWLRIAIGSGASESVVNPEEWRRFRAPEAFRHAVAGIVAPGTTVVVTADSLEAGSTGASATLFEGEPE